MFNIQLFILPYLIPLYITISYIIDINIIVYIDNQCFTQFNLLSYNISFVTHWLSSSYISAWFSISYKGGQKFIKKKFGMVAPSLSLLKRFTPATPFVSS